nr:MAG TPA: hypothetical protein [Caudoviricetes sp.]
MQRYKKAFEICKLQENKIPFFRYCPTQTNAVIL